MKAATATTTDFDVPKAFSFWEMLLKSFDGKCLAAKCNQMCHKKGARHCWENCDNSLQRNSTSQELWHMTLSDPQSSMEAASAFQTQTRWTLSSRLHSHEWTRWDATQSLHTKHSQVLDTQLLAFQGTRLHSFSLSKCQAGFSQLEISLN